MSAGLHVRLLVPGLLGPLPGMQATDFPWPDTPMLGRLLGRAETHPGPLSRLDLLKTHFLDTERLEGLAELSFMGEFGHRPRRPVLRADAVHFRADRDQLVLFGPEVLAVSPEEARALAAAFNAHFDREGLHLVPSAEGRGYLRLSHMPEIETRPLEMVVGQPVADFLSTGRGGIQWKRWLTEMQMLLANHAVNLERQVNGRPTINGLWCWGEGAVPPPRSGLDRHAVLHVGDPLFRGTAMHCGLQLAAPPGFESGFRVPVSDRGPWIFVDDLRLPAAYGELERWRELVSEFDRLWLAPAFRALRRGEIRILDLVPMNGRVYRLRWHRSWLIWRTEHPSRHAATNGMRRDRISAWPVSAPLTGSRATMRPDRAPLRSAPVRCPGAA